MMNRGTSMKKKKLKKNEIRVIKVDQSAIKELLWETLMENGNEWLDIKENSNHVVYHMFTDDSMKELVFYACNMSSRDVPNFNAIDDYLKNNISITANSFFALEDSGERYIRLKDLSCKDKQ